MKRFGHVVVGVVLATAWTAGTALAQPADSPWAVQVAGGSNVGHSSGLSFGAEVDRRLSKSLDLFVELGHMGNITAKSLQDRAAIIGTAIDAVANPIQKATYYDFGLRYHLRPEGAWNPYVLVGFGGTSVSTATSFTQAGAQLTDTQLAGLVQLGVDLDGSISKAFFVLGGGVQVPLTGRYFFEGSYRYGRVLPRTSVIDGDVGVAAQRVQIGLGLRF